MAHGVFLITLGIINKQIYFDDNIKKKFHKIYGSLGVPQLSTSI